MKQVKDRLLFAEVPDVMGQRHEPVVRGKGVPVWVLVAYAKRRGMTPEQISKLWNGDITLAEVKASLSYAEAHPDLVEDKLVDAD